MKTPAAASYMNNIGFTLYETQRQRQWDSNTANFDYVQHTVRQYVMRVRVSAYMVSLSIVYISNISAKTMFSGNFVNIYKATSYQ